MLVTPTVPLCGVFFGTPLAGTHIPTRQPLTVLSTVRGVALSSGLFLAQELVHQPIKQPDKGSPNSGLCQHTDESVHGGMEPPCIPPLVTEQGSPDRKSTRGCMSYQAVDIPLCCLDF